ncbi:glycosyltransferase [Jannaschia seohaensis]|uniref:Glycosyltransferase involved in cell wall biosynthesis n=1 Tax=Jannaschia seohaensis TaxID=475081 RepID=A0A2Y9A8D9_9RHOB|nr:glycosyltransferase [Jannaschia seohaensis]PWJ22179.1 glycosyltransferase involved in cell wall biosynthesis [Jannaschia seohaensis]SSA38457.1 Glycosyltransferase involved in cell wall bisynthesis [Jannaschia seohaensis]
MPDTAPGPTRRRPRIALVHYWLTKMRGGEKVLESLCRMFPEADIVTHVADPSALSDTLTAHRIRETWIGRLPAARRLYQAYLPLMPRALEAVDLTGYDLVISSEAGPAKGVIAPPDAFHLCYCHSPMRYLWDQYHTYRDGTGPAQRAAMSVFAHGLRQWDVTSAARVDAFAANSGHVAARIEKYWRRPSTVVHPPVAVEDFAPAPGGPEEFYLWAGELAPYKRPDMAVEAFGRLGLPLVVIGGPDKTVAALKARATPNVTFLGRAPFPVLKDHLARCRALIFPGEEDFGIVPVEAMASGRPVIAYGRGGALDTVVDGETGLLFPEQSVDALVAAVERFEAERLWDVDPARLVAHAQGFSEAAFQSGIRAMLPAGLA